MSSRRGPRRFWPTLLVFTSVALLAGWVIGGVLGGRTLPRIPLLYRTPPAPSAPSGAAGAAAGDDLGAMSRAKLERETRRLREDLAEKNRQLDDLKIQVKLLSDGSRTATK